VSSGSPLSKPLLDETLYNFPICGSVMALAGLKPASAGSRHHELVSRAKSVGRPHVVRR